MTRIAVVLTGLLTIGFSILLGLVQADALGQGVVVVPPPPDPKPLLYTAYNLWYEKPGSMSSINYHIGAFIPAGTQVTNIQTGLSRRRVPTVSFQQVGNPMTYVIHFQQEYHPGLQLQQFVNRLFTGADFEDLTLGMTPQEIKCIRQGILEPGIRKNAVVIAYGYPPEHQTPTMERDVWYYWERRMDRLAYTFSPQGLLERWEYQ